MVGGGLIYKASGFVIGAFGPSDFNRTVPVKKARASKQRIEDILGMFADDPDPTVMTARVRFGTTFGRARDEGRGLMRDVRLDLVVGSGLCRKPWVERREERDPATVFGDQKRPTLDRLYCRYSYPLGHQTNSDCDETWQAVY